MGLSALIPTITDIVNKVIPDKAEADRLNKEFAEKAVAADNAEMATRASVIVAEAKGESWMQQNWRPLTMLVFTFIIANNYVLLPYIDMLFSTHVPKLELSENMWELLKLGMGGYVFGRSAEKMVETYARTKRAPREKREDRNGRRSSDNPANAGKH